MNRSSSRWWRDLDHFNQVVNEMWRGEESEALDTAGRIFTDSSYFPGAGKVPSRRLFSTFVSALSIGSGSVLLTEALPRSLTMRSQARLRSRRLSRLLSFGRGSNQPIRPRATGGRRRLSGGIPPSKRRQSGQRPRSPKSQRSPDLRSSSLQG